MSPPWRARGASDEDPLPDHDRRRPLRGAGAHRLRRRGCLRPLPAHRPHRVGKDHHHRRDRLRPLRGRGRLGRLLQGAHPLHPRGPAHRERHRARLLHRRRRLPGAPHTHLRAGQAARAGHHHPERHRQALAPGRGRRSAARRARHPRGRRRRGDRARRGLEPGAVHADGRPAAGQVRPVPARRLLRAPAPP